MASRSNRHADVGRAARVLTAAVITGTAGLAAGATEPLSRAERQAAQALSVDLGLSADQAAAWAAQRLNHDRQLQALALRAQALGTAAGDAVARHRLCSEAVEHEASLRRQLRASLEPAQLQRLAQLEQALALMPVVEAAQRTGWLPAQVRTAPPGLPPGAVEVGVRWQRVAVAALPGCDDTTVRREVDDGRTPRKPTLP